MHEPKSFNVVNFGSATDPLSLLKDIGHTQALYLFAYLSVLGAKSVLEEPQYFDRDYLDEFSSFYSRSSRGYSNTCRRIHFFSEEFTKEYFLEALGGDENKITLLRDSYLGFSVLRPIPATPFGRTVVKWYPELTPKTPRVTHPARYYSCHIAGLKFLVQGLAWQQQDSAVGACATIGIWSMLHSSAFDDHHAIPTTASITKAAHKAFSLGSRVFPSNGLTVQQLMGAIRDSNLAPVIVSGDLNGGFSKARFSSICASFIRSKYPVLIWGQHIADVDAKHVVCAVGFRETELRPVVPETFHIQDSETTVFYIHDDNLGPNVRFEVLDHGLDKDGNQLPITIKTVPPVYQDIEQPGSPTDNYPEIRPEMLFVAVHEDLRTSPETLHTKGMEATKQLTRAINEVLIANGLKTVGLTFSTRFIKLPDYLGPELEKTLGGNPRILSKVRSDIFENVPPMSLHIGVIRIALASAGTLVDILYDTTDSDRNHPAFANIAYGDLISTLLKTGSNYGITIDAFEI